MLHNSKFKALNLFYKTEKVIIAVLMHFLLIDMFFPITKLRAYLFISYDIYFQLSFVGYQFLLNQQEYLYLL